MGVFGPSDEKDVILFSRCLLPQSLCTARISFLSNFALSKSFIKKFVSLEEERERASDGDGRAVGFSTLVAVLPWAEFLASTRGLGRSTGRSLFKDFFSFVRVE